MKRKKQGRSERTKLTEKLKTVIIVLLLALCVWQIYTLLGVPLGSGSKALFFGLGKASQSSGGSAETTAENALKTFSLLSEPETVIVNAVDRRTVLKPGSDMYKKSIEVINKTMRSIHSQEAAYTRLSGDGDWRSALKAPSLYLKYPYSKPVNINAEFLGIKDSPMLKNISAYSEALLLPNPAANGNICVLIPEDPEYKNIFKIETNIPSSSLSDILSSNAYTPQRECMFACELNLDRSVSAGSGSASAATLSPMVIIPSENINPETVSVSTPYVLSHSTQITKTTDFSLELLELFGYNSNTVRKYTNSNGSLVFVGESGTLSISPSGIIEYKALDEKVGITVSPAQTKAGDLYTPIAQLMGITQRIFSLCEVPLSQGAVKLGFSSAEVNKATGSVSLSADYFINSSILRLPGGHAATAVIKDNVLTEIKLWVKTLEVSEGDSEGENLLEAVNRFCAQKGGGSHIESAKLVYNFKEDGAAITPVWEIIGDAGK